MVFFFSCVTVVLGSLVSNDRGCVCNRSFCRRVNIFIPNRCCFCLCRLGWWTTEGANHHSSCLGCSCWSCHTLWYWVFWQCPEATVEGYQTTQGKGEIKDLSCFLVRNAITVRFQPIIPIPNSLPKWWFFWTCTWKRPPVVWLLQETTSLKQPVTLHILGANLWEGSMYLLG